MRRRADRLTLKAMARRYDVDEDCGGEGTSRIRSF